MSSILDAINAGKQKAKGGRERRVSKFFSSPASPDKLIRLFHTTCADNGLGEPLPLSLKARGMLNGFIKLGRNNGWKEEKFYNTIKDLVVYWADLRRKELTSLNGKRIVIGDRPSLLEFFIGRDSILSAIEDIKNREDKAIASESQTIIEPEKEVEDPALIGPTEEDMRKHYEDQMENMF